MSEPNVTVVSAPRARMSVKIVTSLGMLTAVAYVTMLLSKMLPQVYGFLQLDVQATAITIGGFLFGPLAAAAISVVLPIIEMLTVSDTGPIGCLMNMLATASFCCTAAFVYKKMHTRKGAVIGLTLGVIAQVAVMLLWNYLITPIYQGVPRDVVAGMLPTVFLPFNLVKGGLNMGLILVLYKPVVTALRRAKLAPESQTMVESRKINAGFLLFSLAVLGTFVTIGLGLFDFIFFCHPYIFLFRGGGRLTHRRRLPVSPFRLLYQSRAVLPSLPRHENSSHCPYENPRGQSDKQPLKGVEEHSNDGGLRIAVVPAQIRTAEFAENHKNRCCDSAQRDQQPVPRLSSHGHPLCQLEVDDLQFLANHLQTVSLRCGNRLSQQSVHGCFKHL